MKKHVVSLLLCLVLCLSLLPAFAAADGEQGSSADNPYILTQDSFDSATTDSSPIKYKSEYDYSCYELSSGYYRLDGDITLDFLLQVPGRTDVTLDLNGHVLKLNSEIYGGSASGCVIFLKSDFCILTLEDSSPTTEHKFTQNSDGLWVLDEENGTKIICGGIITGGNAVSQPCFTDGVYNDGTFKMNGGNIVGCKAKNGGAGVSSESSPFYLNGGSVYDSVLFRLCPIYKDASATGTIFYGDVENYATIPDGIYYGDITNSDGSITGGVFYGDVASKIDENSYSYYVTFMDGEEKYARARVVGSARLAPPVVPTKVRVGVKILTYSGKVHETRTLLTPTPAIFKNQQVDTSI